MLLNAGGFERFVGLRKANPKLKVLVSMGGWKGDADRYSRIIADPVRRARLINSIQDLVDAQRFDGFDFYWGNGSSHQNHVRFPIKIIHIAELPQNVNRLVSGYIHNVHS